MFLVKVLVEEGEVGLAEHARLAAVAQLVERLTSNQEVPSSILGGGLLLV